MIQSPFPSHEEFRFWLALVRPETEFPFPHTMSIVAQFLEHCGFKSPRVGFVGWAPLDETEWRWLPRWTSRFIIETLKEPSLSPPMAIEILDRIAAEDQG